MSKTIYHYEDFSGSRYFIPGFIGAIGLFYLVVIAIFDLFISRWGVLTVGKFIFFSTGFLVIIKKCEEVRFASETNETVTVAFSVVGFKTSHTFHRDMFGQRWDDARELLKRCCKRSGAGSPEA